MLLLTSILICISYFHMTKVIRVRNVKTARNIEPKHWSQISGPELGSLFWI